MAEGMNASDVALLARDNDGWGNGMGFMWIFALMILANGGFGGWGNNGFANAIGYENLATSNEVQRGFDNQNSMANQREILAAVNAGTAQGVATSNQVFHDLMGVFNDKYTELQRDISGVALMPQQAIANQNECCCTTQRAIDGVNYNLAMQASEIKQAIAAEGQATRDMYQQNRMADMQSRINQLELGQALQGVVRYPEGFMYNAGTNPFCNNGCGC